MSFPADNSASENAEKRQPRQSRLVKAALESERFGRFDVTIRNVSRTGIGGRGSVPLDRGERITVFLPGHRPMMGTVRWIGNDSFGIETDGEIRPEQLRAAHGGGVPATDQSVEFRIIPPSNAISKRPGLSLGVAPPTSGYGSDWRLRR